MMINTVQLELTATKTLESTDHSREVNEQESLPILGGDLSLKKCFLRDKEEVTGFFLT